jgi:putative oxidoreductase
MSGMQGTGLAVSALDRVLGVDAGSRSSAWVMLVARLLLVPLFLHFGWDHLTDLTRFTAIVASKGVPYPFYLAVLGAIIELFAAVAILIGFKTRYAALAMIVFILAATALAHRFWQMEDAARVVNYLMFMKNIAICGGLLMLFAQGPGAFSVDRK